MTWFFAVLIVALMGAVAVVATGRGGSMSETFDDRPDVRVPADRPLTGADVRRVRFTSAFRGYRAAEVDALLDRLAGELESREEPADDQASGREPDGGEPDGGEPEGPTGWPVEPPA